MLNIIKFLFIVFNLRSKEGIEYLSCPTFTSTTQPSCTPISPHTSDISFTLSMLSTHTLTLPYSASLANLRNLGLPIIYKKHTHFIFYTFRNLFASELIYSFVSREYFLNLIHQRKMFLK